MADRDLRASDGTSSSSECTGSGVDSRLAGPPAGNHAPLKGVAGPDSSGETTSSAPDDRSGLDRAEEMIDSLAERVSSLTSTWGRKLLRLGSRARESAQDFWAEVQDFRQGKKP